MNFPQQPIAYQQPPAGNGQALPQPGPAPQPPFAGPSPASGIPAQAPGFPIQPAPQQPGQYVHPSGPQPPQFNPAQYQQPAPQPGLPQPLTAWQQPAYLPQPEPQLPASSFEPPAQPQQPTGADPSLWAAYQQYAQQQAAQGQPVPPPPNNPWAQPPQEPEWNVEQYFKDLVKAPEWNPAFDHAINNGYVMKDPATGAYVPASAEVAPLAAGIVPALNDYERHRATVLQDFLSENPYQKVYGALEEPVKHMIDERAKEIVQETLREQQEDQLAQQYEVENASWMHANVNGQTVLTPAGKAMREATQELYSNGVPLDRAIEYAEGRVRPAMVAQQQQPPPQQGPTIMPPDPYYQGMQQPAYPTQPATVQPPPPQAQQPYAQGYSPQPTPAPAPQPEPQQPVGYAQYPTGPPPAQQSSLGAPQGPSFLESAAQMSGYAPSMSSDPSAANPSLEDPSAIESRMTSAFTNAAAQAGIK